MDVIDLTMDNDEEVIVVGDNQSARKVLSKIGKRQNIVVLKQHQVNVLKSIRDQPGLLAVHRTGSGKTILGLAVRKQLKFYWKQRVFALVIAPKKVVEQYKAEAAKYKFAARLFKFETYDGLRKDSKFESALNFIKDNEYNLIIFDEAHRLSNTETATTQQAFELAKYAKFVLCTTATPIVNDPSDLSSLLALVSGRKLLPMSKKTFHTEFENDELTVIKNRRKFESAWLNLVSVFTNIDVDDRQYYPSFEMITKKSRMSKIQFDYYKAVEDKNIEKLGAVFDVDGNVDASKLGRLNSFLSKTRQMCNTVQKYEPERSFQETSLKLWQVAHYVKKGAKPAVVFSHFLDSGIHILMKIFDELKVSYGVITGSSKDKPQDVVLKYNSREIDVLLLSEAGAEGLDLKATRQIHIVDQPWTDTQMKQVIGRGIRYKSHDHLPLDKRHVEVVQWVTTKKIAQKKEQRADYIYSSEQQVIDLTGGSDSDTDSDISVSDTETDSDSDYGEYDYVTGGVRRRRSPKRKRSLKRSLGRQSPARKAIEKAKLRVEKLKLKYEMRLKKLAEKQKAKELKELLKAKKRLVKKKAEAKNLFPSADEILMKFNLQKKEMTEKFMELLECASIETNLLKIRSKPESCSGADIYSRSRKKLALKDIVE